MRRNNIRVTKPIPPKHPRMAVAKVSEGYKVLEVWNTYEYGEGAIITDSKMREIMRRPNWRIHIRKL